MIPKQKTMKDANKIIFLKREKKALAPVDKKSSRTLCLASKITVKHIFVRAISNIRITVIYKKVILFIFN